MSQNYRLPCSCGQEIVVQTSQAGQNVTCACGRTVEAPRLRELRLLQPAEATPLAEYRAPVAQVSFPRIVFVLSLIGLVATSLYGGLMFLGLQSLDLGMSEEQLAQRDSETIDKMNLEQLWGAWVSLRSDGLGLEAPPPELINRYRSKQLRGALTTSGIVAAAFATCGAISAAFSLQRKRRR